MYNLVFFYYNIIYKFVLYFNLTNSLNSTPKEMAKELSLSQSIFGIDINNKSICDWKGGPLQTGTTIVSVKYKDGVILGADSRSSVSSTYVANRLTDKLQPLTDNIFIQRSGSSAHTQNVGDYVQHYLNNLSQELNEQPRVRTAGM